MTGPQLQIDQRCDRIEQAIESLADTMNVGDSVRTILRGEDKSREGEGEVTPEEIDRAHDIARAHHEAYLRLAPTIPYTPSSPTSWYEMPDNQKLLLVGVISDMLGRGVIQLPKS